MVRGWWSTRAAGCVVALAVCVAALPAQTPGPSGGRATSGSAATPVKLPAWDVVSVHLAEPGKCTQGSGMRASTDGVSTSCVPLLFVIEAAYGIMEPSRILDAPDWVKRAGQYDIDAKVAGEDVAAYGKLSFDDRDRMLQSLLAERFHMKAHVERREMPVYDLVVAKGGPKLKVATMEEASDPKLDERLVRSGKVEAVGVQLTSLSGAFLKSEVGRTVVDKTGLTRKYDFTLEFVPAAKAATDETGGPSIFTALEEQLGLKLEPAKEPMDVLVIDSIEQPTAN